ncbi:MAG: hypothetical protein HOI66_17750 [Verrucomicrobia bacterium]|jgi:hypothetical protein|nr:hypothetical protein [Verrucomicrobiota bacterium]
MSPENLHRLKLLAAGIAFLTTAAALPIYLRAVDSQVVSLAGKNTKTLAEAAQDQLLLEKPGITALLLEGAAQCGITNLESVTEALKTFRITSPELTFWGGAFPDLDLINVSDKTAEASIVKALISKQTRESLFQRLELSRRPGVQALLDNRYLNHTKAFPPVNSPGGAALDAVITATAMLSQGDYLSTSFRIEMERLASDANRGHSTQDLESAYLDLLAFGKKMNWAQFSGLMSRIDSRESLRQLAHTLAANPDEFSRLYVICWMSPSIQIVSDYLAQFPDSGLEDLSFGLANHQGALASVLGRQERVYRSDQRIGLLQLLPIPGLWFGVAHFCQHYPWIALLTKYLAILLGTFSLIRLAFDLMPRPALTPHIFRVEGIATLQQQILALSALGLFVLLGEPFLAQKGQTDETPLNWRFPTAPAAVVDKVDNMVGEKVDEMTLLALVLFFLVQAVLYALCLVKVKEIEKQKGSPRLKLKLLDNEDNMFDAGLYVGLGGTVLSLLILTLKLAAVGLMAAYASTLFGIIFVSILKILHVRPVRRKFLIEAEAGIL